MEAAQLSDSGQTVTFLRSRTFQAVIFAVLYLCLATWLIYWAFSNWAYDDPFITYRYAQNLAQGAGFVYNAGEHVLSTTTPLFTLLLAVLSILWKDLPHLANLLGSFFLAVGGWFIWDLAHSWRQPARMATTLVGLFGLLLYPTFPLVIRTLGSETPLYIALCLGAFAFYARRNYNLAGVMTALAVLTRPDGALVAIILAAHYLLFIRRPIPWMAIILFLLITLPWFAFSWVYFGSALPATLAAKQHQGAMAISQRFAPGLLTVLGGYTRLWYFWLECILGVFGLIWMAWKVRIWGLFLSWTLLYFTAYTILGVSRYYWYYAPLVPGFVVAAGLGAAGLCTLFVEAIVKKQAGRAEGNPSEKPLAAPKNLPGWIIYLPLGILLLAFLGQLRHIIQIQPQLDWRIAAYQATGDWLKQNTPTGARIGTLEIGAIGYYSGHPVIDFGGLIQPEVAAQIGRDTTYADLAVWAVEHYRPEYLVLHEGVFPQLEQGYAAQHCQFINEILGAPYKYNKNLKIYACQD